MAFAWTERQFVAGNLSLDLTNTVFHAEDPARRGDRLRTADDIVGWLAAAVRFGSAGASAGMLTIGERGFDAAAVAEILALRQATDDLFRAIARKSPPSPLAFRRLLFDLGRAVPDTVLAIRPDGLGLACAPAGIGATHRTVQAALAHSALALAGSPQLGRLKACPNCDWLFVDRSRNASRVWCDMLTCGNRAKAQRHYRARSLEVA